MGKTWPRISSRFRTNGLNLDAFKRNWDAENFCAFIIRDLDEFWMLVDALRLCDVSHHLVGMHSSLGFAGKHGAAIIVEVDAVNNVKMITHAS